LPLGDGGRDLEAMLDFYARRGRRPLVQIAPAEARAGMDAELAGRGWSSTGPTEVLVAGAVSVLSRTAPGDVAIVPRLGARWPAAWAACEQRPDADEHAREVLSRIEPATAYALAAGDAGVGLAVCERGWAGLYRVAPG
jgi:hypothetical protein